MTPVDPTKKPSKILYMNFLRGKLLNFWTTKPRGGGTTKKKIFFAASLREHVKKIVFLAEKSARGGGLKAVSLKSLIHEKSIF